MSVDSVGIHIGVGRFYFNFFWLSWAWGRDRWSWGSVDYWLGPFNVGWTDR